VLDRATATLTMREHETDPRVPIPASDWDLARAETKDGRVVLTPSNVDLRVKCGFKTGWIYEFIYDTEGSRVMNLGFLAGSPKRMSPPTAVVGKICRRVREAAGPDFERGCAEGQLSRSTALSRSLSRQPNPW
jgi:hypothetical protein